MEERITRLVDDLLHDAARRLHAWPRQHPSVLEVLLDRATGAASVERGPLRPWGEVLIRTYVACRGPTAQRSHRHMLASVVASFVAAMSALEILDDMIDGDDPVGGAQAPNLALALLGESVALLGAVPPLHRAPLLVFWGERWAQCASAQARDVALSAQPDLRLEQALAAAEGSGAFTGWAVEAGALLAGAGDALRTPLAAFGHYLGTAEKLLHDVHELWPGDHPARDLYRPSCNVAVVLARDRGLLPHDEHAPGPPDEAILRQRLLESGVLHDTWAYADRYRLQAAAALERFARAGGDPAPLVPVLGLTPELQRLHDGAPSPVALTNEMR